MDGWMGEVSRGVAGVEPRPGLDMHARERSVSCTCVEVRIPPHSRARPNNNATQRTAAPWSRGRAWRACGTKPSGRWRPPKPPRRAVGPAPARALAAAAAGDEEADAGVIPQEHVTTAVERRRAALVGSRRRGRRVPEAMALGVGGVRVCLVLWGYGCGVGGCVENDSDAHDVRTRGTESEETGRCPRGLGGFGVFERERPLCSPAHARCVVLFVGSCLWFGAAFGVRPWWICAAR